MESVPVVTGELRSRREQTAVVPTTGTVELTMNSSGGPRESSLKAFQPGYRSTHGRQTQLPQLPQRPQRYPGV